VGQVSDFVLERLMAPSCSVVRVPKPGVLRELLRRAAVEDVPYAQTRGVLRRRPRASECRGVADIDCGYGKRIAYKTFFGSFSTLHRRV